MKTSIYYFTGTGNSLEVARDLERKLGESQLISIPSLINYESITPAARTIGIVFPVYDWNAPLVVQDFIKKLDLREVTYIFAIATCNFLPGGSLDHIDSLLKEKGRSLAAGFIIRMPGNYLPFYGPNPRKMQQYKFRKKDLAVIRIAKVISANQIYKIEYKGIFLDRLLSHKFRHGPEIVNQSDTNFYTDEKCNGCGICSKLCAFDSIELVDGKPNWKHRCHRCFACIHLCPKMAIQYGKNTAKKKRYLNPQVTLEDIIQSGKPI